jgi:threonine aldolase
MAEAIAALVNATVENARLLREMAQNNQNIPQGNRGHNNQDETTYVDFTDTRAPVFTRADEPLEADDWLRTMEQKFDLIHCTEYQKCLQPNSLEALRELGGQTFLSHSQLVIV